MCKKVNLYMLQLIFPFLGPAGTWKLHQHVQLQKTVSESNDNSMYKWLVLHMIMCKKWHVQMTFFTYGHVKKCTNDSFYTWLWHVQMIFVSRMITCEKMCIVCKNDLFYTSSCVKKSFVHTGTGTPTDRFLGPWASFSYNKRPVGHPGTPGDPWTPRPHWGIFQKCKHFDFSSDYV